jgi:hypothetical protein
MTETETRQVRVLIANEKRERLELLAQVVAGLGHEVIAREIYVKEVGAVTARERPDVALVGLGLHSEHALELISEIVRESSCPVIAGGGVTRTPRSPAAQGWHRPLGTRRLVRAWNRLGMRRGLGFGVGLGLTRLAPR